MSLTNSIKSFFDSYRQKREQDKKGALDKYKEIALRCESASKELFSFNSQYINVQIKESWKQQFDNLYQQIKHDRKYLKIKLSSDLANHINDFKNKFSKIDEICAILNKQFIEEEKTNYKELFDNIEGRALDEQQRECIVKDEINNLVVAGAGSGKTTTIVGKVKYLIKRYHYDPSEILVLSFTNASSTEMSGRIKGETGKSIDVMTFHKLGLEIITEVEGAKPSLTTVELEEFVNEKFIELTKEPSYNILLSMLFLSYLKQYKSRFNFKNEGEYIDYLKDANIRTLKNQIVKSYEEMEIANFLHINNIKYEYEKKYEKDTKSKEYKQYIPDFYLTDYNIYIEHFGIDRQGNVPSFFEGKNGLTAKETYNNSIKWKRQLHKDNNTILVETYSYEKAEGTLTENLKKKLEGIGVKFNPMSRNEIWALIETDKTNSIKGFVKLIGTFISLLKSKNYDIDKVKNINRGFGNLFERMRNDIFINLVAPIYNSYEEQLINNSDIDFNDMINKATKYVQQGRFATKYSYIIVDEYQDTSMTRFSLIKAIKDKNNAKIFCVGDDWQSIYRFAGSDIGLFTHFEKHFGFTEKSYIETTYRYNKRLINLSGNFILKNKSQIKKQLRPYKDNESTAFELVYGNNRDDLCSKLKQNLSSLPNDASVALLGRYKGDLEPYLDNEITSRFNYHTKKLSVYYTKRKDLNIEYMTIHKSKGLQADYVFILNNTNKKYGFPSQIEDDPVLKLFSQDIEDFPFAEERRLFYVALTRAKKFVYLMIEDGSKSSFIREIEEDFKLEVPLGKGGYCPKCKKGSLELKSGPHSDFYACSNYPLCRYTHKAIN